MNNEQFYIDELKKKAGIIFFKNVPASDYQSVSQLARLKSLIADILVKLKASIFYTELNKN